MNERSRKLLGRPGLRLPASLLLSLLLHLAALLTIEDWRRGEREAEAFRARLRQVLRFDPERFTAAGPEVVRPRTEMEYRPAGALPRPRLEEPEVPRQPAPPVDAPVALRPFDIAARADTFRAEPEPDLLRALAAAQARGDSIRRQSLDLMRVLDLAQGHERAVVRSDPDSRRDLTGFVNLTRFFTGGAGGGRSSLEALARYMRDRTPLLVRVRPEPVHRFTTRELLRDPIHFLVEGGGLPLTGDWPLLQVSAREKELLEEYLRGGGLLYIEGGDFFLGEAVRLLRELLPEAPGIDPIPAEHPVYHSFFGFPAGFPGEDKQRWDYLKDLKPSWDYPSPDLQPTQVTAANVNPELVESPDLTRNGLWGVSLGDTLVAIVSDLPLHAGWAEMNREEVVEPGQEEQLQPSWAGPALVAGVNLIVHAVTRTGTIASRREQPAWFRNRPRVAAAGVMPVGDPADLAAPSSVDPALEDALDGSVAVLRSPLGESFGAGGLTVRVDGRYRIDLLRPGLQGVLLHNLPAGAHWVEIEYRGASEGVELRLRGGRVATVTFGVSRLAMLSSVRLHVQSDQVDPEAWRLSFSDLLLEEVFLQEDGVPALD